MGLVTENLPQEKRLSDDDNNIHFDMLKSLLESIEKPACIITKSGAILTSNLPFVNIASFNSNNDKVFNFEISVLHNESTQVTTISELLDEVLTDVEFSAKIVVESSQFNLLIKKLPAKGSALYLCKFSQQKFSNGDEAASGSKFTHFMIDNFPFAAWLKDTSGRLTKLNTIFAEFYNEKPENLLGKTDYDLCPPELADRYAEADKWIMENKRDLFFETENYDVQKNWVETYKSPVFDNFGNVVGIMGFARHINDKYFNIQNLRDNEEKFRSVVNSLSEGLIIFDSNGCISEINPAAEQIFAIPSDNLIGKKGFCDVKNCFKEDGSPFAKEEFPIYKSFTDGIVIRNLLMGLSDINGVVSWLKINTTPIFKSGSSTIENVLCSIEDITRQKRFQKALLESREFMEKINNSSPNLIMLYDVDNKRFLYVNNQSLNYLGYEPALIKNFPLEMLHSSMLPSDSENFNVIIEELCKYPAKNSIQTELKIQNSQGDHFWTLANFAVFQRDDKGSPNQILIILTDINEKKRAEILIKESETRYRILAENITDVISIISPDLTFEYISPSIIKMFGLEPAGLLNRPIDVIFTPENYEKLKNYYLDDDGNLLNKKFEKIVLYHNLPNGMKLWSETILNPIFDSGGSITKLIAVTREITEQYNAIEKQRKTELKYRNLFYNMYDGFVKTDLKGNILEFNDAFMNMLNYSNIQELIGKSTSFITPDYYHVIEDNLIRKHVFKKGFSDLFTKEYLRKDGSLLPVEMRFYLLEDDSAPEGKAIWSFVRDITERKRSEYMIKESENRFRSVVEHSPVTIAVTTSEGRIEYVNRAGGELTGYDPPELLNKSITIFSPDDESKKRWEAYHRISFKRRVTEPIELKIKKRNGEIVYGLFQPAFFVSQDTKLMQMNFVIDITERKGAEIRLRESQQKLQEAIASKDKFFSIIAHDLRSPLSGLVGLLKLLVKDFDTIAVTDIYELSSQLLESADNLFRLLENLLEWSRVQRNKVKVSPEVQNVQPIMRTAINLFRLVAQNKNLSLEMQTSDDMVAYCDSNITYSVLRNLISNAIKFTHRGGKILIKCQKGAKGFIIISVTDNGIGIDPNKAYEIFNFDNYHSEKGTENESGSGLGLVLCKELIELQGGEIWLKSTPGKGSTFFFSIPAKPVK